MPGATFVIGQDTAIRLVMPKYYGGEARMMRAFEEIRAHGCSFVVAGRAGHPAAGRDEDEEEARFLTLADVAVPETLGDLFEDLRGFGLDVSSTELRAARGE